DVDLSIPNFQAFAEALGESSKFRDRFEYSGQFALKNQHPDMEGKLVVGKTEIVGNLRGKLQDKKPHLVGNVESKLLHLEDLSGLFDILGLKRNKSKAEIRTEVVKESPKVSLELGLKVDQIAGKNRNVGNINGKLSYQNKVITLDPLSVSYLGGTIRAQAKIDSASKTKKFSSKGNIRRLPIGRLLSQLKAPKMISGSLTTNFDVRGSGDDASSWVKSLSGSVNSSISGGTLGTNLIDLSGLNLLTWLTTSSSNKSVRLVCAVIPLNFSNGRGSTQRLVLETQNVQVVGRGFVDIRNDRVTLNFLPLPKRQQLVNVVSPFQVTGRLSRPSISLKQGAAGRVAAEVVTLPLNILGLLGVGGQGNSSRLKPCVVPIRKTSSTGSKKNNSGKNP
ncbi:MAG: AsmA family protein, partial [Desulfobulbia bacterium]